AATSPAGSSRTTPEPCWPRPGGGGPVRSTGQAPTRLLRKLTGRGRRDRLCPMLRTRLTDILEIDHPVMLAGMGGVSYSALVAAVSEAGGFGTLGASTMGLERMVEEMEAVKALTSAGWGVDLLTAAPGDMEGQVRALIEHGARVFVA